MPTSEALGSNVLDLVLQAGPVAKAVLAILAVFSIVSWALIVDKWWQLRRVRAQTVAFLRAFREGRRPSVVLAAAIPAVIAYNYFVNRVKHWATEMEGFTMDFLNLVARPVPKLSRKDGV